MDRTRPDMGDTQPIPQRVPSSEDTRQDLRRPDGTRHDVRHPDLTRQDVPRSDATLHDLPDADESPHGTRIPDPGYADEAPTGNAHGTEAAAAHVTLRFGPGVPPRVAEAWRGGTRRRPLSRRIAGGLLTVAVALLAALVVWWLLRGGGPAVRVTGVSVRAPKAVQHCDATARIVGTIRTNGGHGDVSYRWRRSDGQVSGVFTETLNKGQRSVQVPLRWTVKGTGTLHAVATLEIVAPQSTAGPAAQASAGFVYSCG